MLCVCAQVSSSGERGNESHVQTHGCCSAGTALGWKVQVNLFFVCFLCVCMFVLYSSLLAPFSKIFPQL